MSDSGLSPAQKAEAEQTVQQFLRALESLDEFSYSSYVDGVKGLLGVDSNNWSGSCGAPVCGEDPGGSKAVVNRFKVETIALGVSRSSGYGFNNCVVQDGLADRIDATASSLVIPIYRQHLEDHVLSATGNEIDLLSALQDQGFCEIFATTVLDRNFINNCMIARYFDQPQYVEAIAYIYERARSTLVSVPTESVVYDDFAGMNISIASVALSSLADVNLFSCTAQASRQLNTTSQTDQFLASTLPITWSDSYLLQGPSFPKLGAAWGTQWRTDTYATDVTNSLIQVASYTTSSGDMEAPPATFVTYGDALWQWMENQQNNGFSDLFHVQGSENFSYVNPFSGSCFTPETTITTASGDRRIDSLGEGDKVLTRAPGEFGFLSDERVVHDVTPKGDGNKHAYVTLYGFNDVKPFVTAGHIFFTVAGPRAIEPSVSRLENANVHVGQLIEGDILLKLNKKKTDYERIKIKKITSAPAKTSTVHGLHFARGGNGGGRYHANGFWVAENYPDITIQALQDRFDQMNPVDRHLFCQTVQKLPGTFQKVFGPTVYNVFRHNFESAMSPPIKKPATHEHRLAAVEAAGKKHVSVKDIHASFKLVHKPTLTKSRKSLNPLSRNFKKHVQEMNHHTKLPEISLSHGAVMIDGVLVKHATMSHLSVQFSHEVPGQSGVYQHGVLRSIGHGKAITGFIGKGRADDSSLSDIKNVQSFLAVANANDYALLASPGTYTSYSDAIAASQASGTTWNNFWKVEIGLVYQDSGLTVQLSMPELDAAWLAYVESMGSETTTLPYYCSPASFDPVNYIAIVPVSVTSGYEDFFQQMLEGWTTSQGTAGPAFNSVNIQVNLQSNAVHGYYTELKEDINENYTDGAIHAVYGADSYSLQALQDTKMQAIQKSDLLGAPSTHASVHDPSSNLHKPALAATQALSTQLFTAADLSIADLQTTPAPSDSDLNSQAQKYMQNAAGYWRGQAEKDVFGDETQALKTTLPTSLTDGLYAGGQSFFAKYSRALIMQALSTQDNYTGRFNDSDRGNMDYYWQGSKTQCISQDNDFNQVTRITTSESFLRQTPALEAYMEDTQDWANMFYAFLTTDTQLNNQALAMFLGNSNNLTNRYCMILDAIDTQNRQYDVDLWKRVRDKLLVRPANGTITDDDDEWPEFAQEFAKQLILQVQSDQSSDLFKELNIDLEQLEQQFETTSAEELASVIFSASSDLGRCFIDVFKQIGKISSGGAAKLPQVMSALGDKIAANFPKLTAAVPYLQGISAIAIQSFSIYTSVKFLMNWSNLSDADRAQGILTIVNSVGMIFKDCAPLIQRLRGLDPKSFDYQVSCVTWNKDVGQVGPQVAEQQVGGDGQVNVQPIYDENGIAAVNSDFVDVPLEEQMAEVVTDPEMAAEAASKFSLTEAVTGALAIAANIATAVCIGFQIDNDFKNGQPAGIKAMDIISEAATCAQVVTGAVELGFLIAGAECAALPFVGAVVAVIGIVMMFVEMFVPHNPPEDPVNVYLDQQKPGFTQTLPDKPQPLLTYHATSTFSLNGLNSMDFTITDPSNSGVLVKSFIIKFTAGTDGTALFLAPSGSDVNHNPTINPVTYTIANGRTDFLLAGGKFAGTSDNSMMLKVTSKDAAGTAIGSQGLAITITGNANSAAGTAKLKVTEGAVRTDGVGSADVYQYFSVVKS